MEIFTRLAKAKFLDSKIVKNIGDAISKMVAYTKKNFINTGW
jgi:hypothetical protein